MLFRIFVSCIYIARGESLCRDHWWISFQLWMMIISMTTMMTSTPRIMWRKAPDLSMQGKRVKKMILVLLLHFISAPARDSGALSAPQLWSPARLLSGSVQHPIYICKAPCPSVHQSVTLQNNKCNILHWKIATEFLLVNWNTIQIRFEGANRAYWKASNLCF